MNNDLISREALKKKLQARHDFWVNAWGGFSNMPLNDKSRVDELSSCIAEVVNAPTVELFCSYLSDGEVRQPCVEGPCEDERPQGEWVIVNDDDGLKSGKCMSIFYRIQEVMEIAEELGNEKIFNLLKETGYKIASILDEEEQNENHTL